MTSELKQACSTLQRQAARPLTGGNAVSHLGRLAKGLGALQAGEAGRTPPDISQIADEIRKSITNGDTPTKRQVRQSAWCLWNENTRLADDPDLRRTLLGHIVQATRPGAFRALAANYLGAFQPDANGIDEAAIVLSALAAKWPGHWADLHERYRIFDVEAGPRRLAKAVVSQDRAPHAILEDFGVSMMSAHGGYVRAVTGALLDHLATGGELDHEKRIGKVSRYALSGEGRLLYADMAASLAAALLEPLAKLTVDKVLRDKLLAVLLKALDDPRLKPTKWLRVPARFTAMVKSWLAEQSLRQFLDVVGDTTDRRDQWRYRRAFWEAAYNAGLFSEAWVAFGPRGAHLARQRFGRDASFGVLDDVVKHVEPGHAVLFMRVGDGVVADWSHNGKCNIWSQMDLPDAPDLYRTKYESCAVLIPGSGNLISQDRFSVSHVSSETYNWQRKVAGRIHQMTGRRLQETDYAVNL